TFCYTLSLHDALPIFHPAIWAPARRALAGGNGVTRIPPRIWPPRRWLQRVRRFRRPARRQALRRRAPRLIPATPPAAAAIRPPRSEEHTSELQSRGQL